MPRRRGKPRLRRSFALPAPAEGGSVSLVTLRNLKKNQVMVVVD
jgi:hypothetical protein